MYVFVPDREPDRLTDSHVKLDTLVDAQESFSTSHHRIALEYDEDTVSLVVDPTLSTLDISISDNSDSSTGNASAFEYECYEVKDDTPWFNDHGPKIKITKQESPVTICNLYCWYNWYFKKSKTLLITLWLRLECLYDQEISLTKRHHHKVTWWYQTCENPRRTS